MDEKFKQGLANQTFLELDNIKSLREDFLAAGAGSPYTKRLEDIMDSLYELYKELTRK